MAAALVFYRALAFSAGSISAVALAVVLGIIGPKRGVSEAETDGKPPVFGEAIPDVSAPSVVARPMNDAPREESAPRTERRAAPIVAKSQARLSGADGDPHEIESHLHRTLEKRGLTLEDLDMFSSAASAKARFLAAKRSGDAREIESATNVLIHEAEAAAITPELLKKRLDAIALHLQEEKSSIAPDRFQTLEGRYLDLAAEQQSANGERALVGLLVRISELQRDLRALRRH